jgi:MFS transporter, SP family, arabinose:H+ symporter
MKRLQGPAYTFYIAFVASVGGFLFGYDLAVMSVANQYLKTRFQLSEGGHGFTTASAILGCAAGPFLGAWLCDRIGRRSTLLWSSLLLALGALLTALPRDIITFNVFRIVGGVGVGLCSIASPMYIAEISPPNRRGALGFMYQLAIVAGMILSIAISCQFAEKHLDSSCWRWMFGSEMVPVVLFIAFLLFIPEPPRWLAARGREDEALAVLTRIEGPKYAQKEIVEIRNSLHEETGSWKELFRPGLRMALTVGILLAIFNNYTGWSGIYNYLPSIFKQAGYKENLDANFQNLVAFSFMGVMTLAACFLVDRFGRRPLWLLGSLMMIAANCFVGLLLQFHVTGFLIPLGICLMAIPHSFALGPLPWLMMSELYPTRNRARAVAITTTVLWITSFFPVMLYPYIEDVSKHFFGTISGVFGFYASLSALALLFGWLMLPETKGRTLEEISRSWKRR